MASKVKEVTTTIEDEVVFMVDPQVEFVSLVKYGANRAPFKVLKQEKPTKEESNMNKVVQSVLVRNDLSDEDITKALEGIDRRDEKHFSTFTAYPQVSVHKCKEDSLIVQKHEEVDGIFFVLGDLAEDTGNAGTLQVDVKEAVDYATMDNLYSELYAMADVVGGAMRQENAEPEFRKTTILTTIDNFRAFAEVVLENLSEKMLTKAVDPKDHPALVLDILHAPEKKEEGDEGGEGGEAETDEEKKVREAAEAKAKADAEAEGDGDKPNLDFNEVVTRFNESLNNFGETLIASIGKAMKEVADSNKKTAEVVSTVVAKMEEAENTTVTTKAEKDEEEDTGSTMSQSDKLFKGSFFSSMSDFR
jgi:hypothetical protein